MPLIPEQVQKIAILRPLHLGDMLCIIPAMRALRHVYPTAHITLLGMPWAKSFVERFNQYFDEFVECPGLPGLPELHFNPKVTAEFFLTFQQQNYDLLLQMHDNGTVINPLIELFGAQLTGGFYTVGYYEPNSTYFTPYPDFGLEVERHVRLMDFLGASSQGLELEFPISAQDEVDFNALNLPVEKYTYVCIHPGSREISVQWPASYFAALADYCAEQGYQPVITGIEEELPVIQEVINQMKSPAINVGGLTSLGAMGILIKSARALISVSTGITQIADAFRTPSVMISMDGQPERWELTDKQIHHTIDWVRYPVYELVADATAELLGKSNSELL